MQSCLSSSASGARSHTPGISCFVIENISWSDEGINSLLPTTSSESRPIIKSMAIIDATDVLGQDGVQRFAFIQWRSLSPEDATGNPWRIFVVRFLIFTLRTR